MDKRTRMKLNGQIAVALIPVRKGIARISSMLSSATDQEQEKLDNLPEGLAEGVIAEGISETTEQFLEAIELMDDASASIDELVDTLGLDEAKATATAFSAPMGEKKDTRLQLLTTRSMKEKLNSLSAELSCSVNSIINSALEEFLSKS